MQVSLEKSVLTVRHMKTGFLQGISFFYDFAVSIFSAFKNGGVLWDTYKNPVWSEDRGLVSRGYKRETADFGEVVHTWQPDKSNRLKIIADFMGKN